MLPGTLVKCLYHLFLLTRRLIYIKVASDLTVYPPFLVGSISNILHIIQQSVDGKLLSVITEDLEAFQSRLVFLQADNI